jgi:hypothetical protein
MPRHRATTNRKPARLIKGSRSRFLQDPPWARWGALGRHAFNLRTSTVTRVELTKAYRAEILGEEARLHPGEPASGETTPRHHQAGVTAPRQKMSFFIRQLSGSQGLLSPESDETSLPCGRCLPASH